jgi:hypothetical protein
MLAVAVVVALAVPVLAWSATNIAPGKYSGKINSVVPQLNGKSVNAEVKTQAENMVITVTYDDKTKEDWIVNPKTGTLTQKEYDAAGKMTQEYVATAKKPGEVDFYVNCKDAAKNVCDAGVKANSYWTIKNNPDNSWSYIFTGTRDANAPIAKRHEFIFKASK